METEPAESRDSTPPADTSETTEEPAPAVPTGETTPVWAQTRPVAPPEEAPGEAVDSEAEVFDSTPPVAPTVPPKGLPEKAERDSSKSESSSNGKGGKKTPEWARTVPTDPGSPVEAAVGEEATATEPPDASRSTDPGEAEEAVAHITEPPKAVAADATKSTWPPASESSPAPPEETDIWPPEPPTEHAMPAWPPPSELEEPVTPAQVIPSWPDSFDPVPQAPAAQAPTVPAAPPVTAPTITPPAGASTPPPSAPVAPALQRGEPKAAPTKAPAPPPPSARSVQSVPSVPPTPTEPPAPIPRDPIPPAASEPPPKPSTPAAASQPPVAPAQPGPPSRPVWAPKLPEPGGEAPPETKPPAPLNVPAWAPRVPLAAEPGTPTWFSPKEQVPHTTAQPAAQSAPTPQAAPASAPPAGGGQLPVAKIPATPAKPAQAAQPGQAGTAKPTWEVVNQPSKSGPHAKAEAGPTAEDRSYAEWFAWAKRGGAPASACHAAAQGAFKALSTGKDVTTAVQWATAAMSRPPENVSYTRQTYCAWFSLANIDLNLDQHRAHAFAMAAVQVLDAGQDAAAAHAAGLAAAGIR